MPCLSPFPTLAPSPMTTPSLLYASASSTTATQQGGLLSGRLESPLTARRSSPQPIPSGGAALPSERSLSRYGTRESSRPPQTPRHWLATPQQRDPPPANLRTTRSPDHPPTNTVTGEGPAEPNERLWTVCFWHGMEPVSGTRLREFQCLLVTGLTEARTKRTYHVSVTEQHTIRHFFVADSSFLGECEKDIEYSPRIHLDFALTRRSH